MKKLVLFITGLICSGSIFAAQAKPVPQPMHCPNKALYLSADFSAERDGNLYWVKSKNNFGTDYEWTNYSIIANANTPEEAIKIFKSELMTLRPYMFQEDPVLISDMSGVRWACSYYMTVDGRELRHDITTPYSK